jgi:hypothetical protein
MPGARAALLLLGQRQQLEAGEGEAGDRGDGKAMLDEGQRAPADATTEVEHLLQPARLQHRHQHRWARREPVGAARRRCPPLVPCLDRRRRHLHLSAPCLDFARAVIIGEKLRCASRKRSAPDLAPYSGTVAARVIGKPAASAACVAMIVPLASVDFDRA